MAAFEKILSGIPEMDVALDHIRFGDNVVWRVSHLSEFEYFMKPFVEQAVADKRKLIYIRFASHAPFMEPQEGVKIYYIDLTHRFEIFAVAIHNIIEAEGRDTFYVFDCLSELQSVWATDLMMGNFFKVTCPLLFQLDTVAFFPMIRGRHSDKTIAKIREMASLLIDVYGDEDVLYVHPLKVLNRYTPRMFLHYMYQPRKGVFHALTDGMEISRYYEVLNRDRNMEDEMEEDSWDRFFRRAKMLDKEGSLGEEALHFMCRVMMTRDEKMRELVKRYFRAEDYFAVRDRMVGTGMIGGKSCGMLLARKIVEYEMPEYRQYMEPHDSFFIGSDVFYTFLVENGCWNLRIRQRTPEGYFSIAKAFQQEILKGHFSEEIRDSFRKVLDYFGRSPIIVRSSSILEDGFGNAFAGKYESVFCVNAGTQEERLEKFEEAVKRVYASTLDESALEYRVQRNLHNRDEQMALLVQRVSGSYFGPYFMPYAAGVGFSYSAYRFMRDMDPAAGMLRIVAGLGTKAVDRTQGDYPRLIALDRPMAYARSNVAERHRYSQRKMDMLDLEKNELVEMEMQDVLDLLPMKGKKNLLEHDTDAENMLRQRGDYRMIYFISCQGLARNAVFTRMMQQILKTLEHVYGSPVDIEYTVNLGEKEDFVANLLQCRPLQTCSDEQEIDIPQTKEEETVIHIQDCCMGRSRHVQISVIVKVDAYEYYSYPYTKKPSVARAIGKLNTYFKQKKMSVVLIVPGRIGTSSPELGVPTTFADISDVEAIFEVAYSEVGYMPELSFGSHMFQDLVEADILYGAVLENKKRLIYQPELLDTHSDHFSDICPEYGELEKMIQVCIFDEKPAELYYNMENKEALLAIKKWNGKNIKR